MTKTTIPVTTIPASAARFHGFTPQERDTIHFACVTAARRILDDAEYERLPDDALHGAAVTFALLSGVARDLDLFAGRKPAGDEEGISMVAAVIAEGAAPEMRRLHDADMADEDPA